MYVWLKDPQRLKAVLIGGREGREGFLECLLFDKGIIVIDRFEALAEAATLKSLPECDLVIVTATAGDDRLAAQVSTFAEKFRRPLLAISETDEPARIAALIDAGATSVLCIGMTTDRVRAAATAAVATFDRQEACRHRAEQAERALEERKLVERAKGILMRQRGIGEPDAFRELQRVSMAKNEPMAAVARNIIAAKELLG